MTKSLETQSLKTESLDTGLIAPSEHAPVLDASLFASFSADTEFELTVGLAELTHQLAEDHTLPGTEAMVALLNRFVAGLPGASCGSLTSQPNPCKPPVTYAATGLRAAKFDELQYTTRQGPCLDALGGAELVRVDDLAEDQRWPVLRQAVRPLPFRSVLSVPVNTADAASQSLNLYAEQPGTFDRCHHPAAYLSAAAAGLALAALRERERALNLNAALDSNRQIGAAMGILMARHQLSYDGAFTALRVASQHLHYKLRDIAEEVVLTGALPSRHNHRPPAAG